ncbi:hypothetical protein GCM10007171_16080 [Dickeya fangzhongdai]|nr:hypothetical protein GCM10007171_16080 [Dickeya fangzhongdai]
MVNLKTKDKRIKTRTKGLPVRVTRPEDASYSTGDPHNNDVLIIQDRIDVIIYVNMVG